VQRGWVWWFRPVIPVSQDVEVGGLQSEGYSGKNHKTLSKENKLKGKKEGEECGYG
jgi:hypothetical protein